ncbi:MAG: iron transporter FeoB [Firmicutes bacterium]|nr:iron transporter FeoB [Bacillota bacterium]
MDTNCFDRSSILKDEFDIKPKAGQYVVALAGNPNVGKSTVFNALTGLRQHTGNWPGKTVNSTQGSFVHQGKSFLLVDLPGTYSLIAHSVEEEIARDFICFGRPDVTVVVVAAACLERNLNLALQVMEITPRVVICVNLLDEAKKEGIQVDLKGLNQKLGVPVVGTVARTGKGLMELREVICQVAEGAFIPSPLKVTYDREVEEAVEALIPKIVKLIGCAIDPRWGALRLLDSDRALIEKMDAYICRNKTGLKDKLEAVI